MKPITLEAFCRKAEQGNLIPIYREILADEETPVSVYEKVRAHLRRRDHASHTWLLESVEGGEHIGRYSFIGGLPRAVLRAYGGRVTIEDAEGLKETEADNPLDILRDYMARYQPVDDPDLPRFIGGAVGFIGYDIVSRFEPRVPVIEDDAIGNPDMVMMVTNSIIVFDRVTHTMKLLANAYVNGDPKAAYADALREIETLEEALRAPSEPRLIDAGMDAEPTTPRSNLTPEAFEAIVEKTREYIRAGDIIQAVLSQRFETDCSADSLDVYRALRAVNPSPYMFCLDMGGSAMVGSSPEIHVRCEDRRVEVRPIAGTRRRGYTVEEDRAMEAELLADPKERAEHIMLVDLARNDIGRVCEYASVHVPELMNIERYSHVMHIVSDVVGRLADGYDAYDVLRVTFPAGTVSGAPKIRAMEIIAEFEPSKRGPYAGAVGYFGFDGNLDSCITIRTIVLDGGKAYVQAGAGIVADSVPALEYKETQNKARGLMKALAMAEGYAAVRREDTES